MTLIAHLLYPSWDSSSFESFFFWVRVMIVQGGGSPKGKKKNKKGQVGVGILSCYSPDGGHPMGTYPLRMAHVWKTPG
jgi:hypothetical protein